MIGGPKNASASSIPSIRNTAESKSTEVGTSQNPRGAIEALRNNPALRSARGESCFEGMSGTGVEQPALAEAVGRHSPEQMINQLGEALSERVATLETLLGSQSAANTRSEVSAESATAASEQEEPMQMRFAILKQLLGSIEQFQQGQGVVPEASATT